MRRNTGRFAALAAVLLVLAAGWWYRDRLVALVAGEPEPVEVSPEAAALAEEKLERVTSGDEEVRLSDVEISSLLRYRAPEWTRTTIGEPAVRLAGDTVRLSGVMATDRLPSHPDLDRVRGLLPDSSGIEVVGFVAPLDSGRVALEIASVEFAGLPIPERYYPEVLERVGRRDEPGLKAHAVALRLPAGVRSARVESGRLILMP